MAVGAGVVAQDTIFNHEIVVCGVCGTGKGKQGQGAEKKQKKAPVTSTGANIARSVSISPEIDLRGMESLEGVLMAERYIDNAVMARLKTVTIIHGKGTGALRAAIQQMLKKNKAVKSFRLGHFGEGESGVTVVELK